VVEVSLDAGPFKAEKFADRRQSQLPVTREAADGSGDEMLGIRFQRGGETQRAVGVPAIRVANPPHRIDLESMFPFCRRSPRTIRARLRGRDDPDEDAVCARPNAVVMATTSGIARPSACGTGDDENRNHAREDFEIEGVGIRPGMPVRNAGARAM